MADLVVGLTEAIGALRQELLAAMGEGKDAAMRFRLAPVELSMQVAVTKEANGKVGWHVLGLGASYSSGTTQTLKLLLEPVWRQDDGSYTSDFTIADQGSEEPAFGPRSGKTHR
jgi:Trypsin-co-occurring domain 2